MNNILNAQEAFAAVITGRNVLARLNFGNEPEEFAPISNFPADIYAKPHVEYCIQIETILINEIEFTKPYSLDELNAGQDVFLISHNGEIVKGLYIPESEELISCVNNGSVQRDFENAQKHAKAIQSLFGIENDLVLKVVDFEKYFNPESKTKKRGAKKQNEVIEIFSYSQLEHNKDLIIDAIATCVTAEEVNTTCFGLEKNGFNQVQLDAIDKAKNDKLVQLAQEKANAEIAADELLNQNQVDTTNPELSVLCDAFVDEINAAVSADEIKAIRTRINSNGDLTEVENAELATRINLKSALFEKEQSHVSFDNIAAAAVAQAQKVDVETQQKNESGHYFDQVKKETAAWNEQLQKLLKDLETTKTPEEANSLVSQTMTWTKEQREPLLRAISRRLQHFQNPQAKENPSISVQIQNATDLTTLDSLEIDVSTLDPIIQPDMMRLITSRRLQLENAANDGVHAS
ncbi:hypothetical protein [Acinetobacter modestus]|uniref:hypothetical protein n=1 Tax=Acinetobacter modestus TaxID=1776740 RepID=UPI003015F8D1